MDRNLDSRPVSVPYKRREPKPFADLLRGATEFSKRRNRRTDKDELQVRIGTSRRNSVAVPLEKLGTLLEIVQEVYDKREEKVQELKELEAKSIERDVPKNLVEKREDPEADTESE